MFVKMSLVVVTTCILVTIVMQGGWLSWLSAAAAFAVVFYVRRVLG